MSNMNIFPYQSARSSPPLLRKGYLKAITLVYTVEEIAQMLSISLRSAYNLCNSTTEFRVLRVGGSIRVPKDSFDAWLNLAA